PPTSTAGSPPCRCAPARTQSPSTGSPSRSSTPRESGPTTTASSPTCRSPPRPSPNSPPPAAHLEHNPHGELVEPRPRQEDPRQHPRDPQPAGLCLPYCLPALRPRLARRPRRSRRPIPFLRAPAHHHNLHRLRRLAAPPANHHQSQGAPTMRVEGALEIQKPENPTQTPVQKMSITSI